MLNADGLSAYEVCLGGARPELAPSLADIHLMCRENDLNSTRVMVNQGVAPDIVEERTGEMAVHSAASTGAVRALAFLVETLKQVPDRLAGVLAHRDGSGATPLGLSSAVPSLECVQILLGAGADPNAGRNADVTPLMLASAKVDGASVVSALLAAGAKVAAVDAEGNTALHAAAAAGHLGPVSRLLWHFPALQHIKNKAGLTPTDLARGSGCPDKDVLALLAGETVGGATLLRCAAAAGDPGRLASFLLTADPDAKDFQGWTAVHHAAAAGNVDCLKLLLSTSTPEAATGGTRTGKASADDTRAAAAAVAVIKARVNRADHCGNTPIMVHSRHRFSTTGVVQVLLDADADVFAANRDGQTVSSSVDLGAEVRSLVEAPVVKHALDLFDKLIGDADEVVRHRHSSLPQLAGLAAQGKVLAEQSANIISMMVKRDCDFPAAIADGLRRGTRASEIITELAAGRGGALPIFTEHQALSVSSAIELLRSIKASVRLPSTNEVKTMASTSDGCRNLLKLVESIVPRTAPVSLCMARVQAAMGEMVKSSMQLGSNCDAFLAGLQRQTQSLEVSLPHNDNNTRFSLFLTVGVFAPNPENPKTKNPKTKTRQTQQNETKRSFFLFGRCGPDATYPSSSN
jgi:ankyrin repeat protein